MAAACRPPAAQVAHLDRPFPRSTNCTRRRKRAGERSRRPSVSCARSRDASGRPAGVRVGRASPPFLPPVRVRPWLPVLCLGLAPAALTHAPFVRARLFLSSSLSLTASYSSTSSLPSGHVVCSLRRPPDTTDVVLPPARWEDMCPAARRAPAHRRTGAPSLPLSLARSRAARERSSGVCLACEALNCRLPGRPAEATGPSTSASARTCVRRSRGGCCAALSRNKPTHPPTHLPTHTGVCRPGARARVGAGMIARFRSVGRRGAQRSLSAARPLALCRVRARSSRVRAGRMALGAHCSGCRFCFGRGGRGLPPSCRLPPRRAAPRRAARWLTRAPPARPRPSRSAPPSPTSAWCLLAWRLGWPRRRCPSPSRTCGASSSGCSRGNTVRATQQNGCSRTRKRQAATSRACKPGRARAVPPQALARRGGAGKPLGWHWGALRCEAQERGGGREGERWLTPRLSRRGVRGPFLRAPRSSS